MQLDCYQILHEYIACRSISYWYTIGSFTWARPLVSLTMHMKWIETTLYWYVEQNGLCNWGDWNQPLLCHYWRQIAREYLTNTSCDVSLYKARPTTEECLLELVNLGSAVKSSLQWFGLAYVWEKCMATNMDRFYRHVTCVSVICHFLYCNCPKIC